VRAKCLAMPCDSHVVMQSAVVPPVSSGSCCSLLFSPHIIIVPGPSACSRNLLNHMGMTRCHVCHQPK
jgi:hypothetical protein